MVNIALPWPPTVNTYYTVARNRKILSQRGRKYKALAQQSLLEQSTKKGLDGKFSVDIHAFPPDERKRDLDNIVKPVFDCLTEYGLFEDDSQIDDFRVLRRKKESWSGIRVYVTEISE